MTDRDFASLFAIAQAAPGPNFLVTTLVGWKAAGLAGALVATAAMCAPSCLLTFWVAKVWDRYRETEWRIAVGAGLAPVTVGFVFSSAFVVVRAADADWRLGAGDGGRRRRGVLHQAQPASGAWPPRQRSAWLAHFG